MPDNPVPLERHFSLVPKSEADSDEQELEWPALALGFRGNQRLKSWDELEKEFRCIILAEAGAGKTFEMNARATHVEKQGRAAFLIRIEYIGDDIETALFEVGSSDTFKKWLNGDYEAWFFLDSIDEARLQNPRTFEKAIMRFAKWIRSGYQRAHVFISSRPSAWRACSDRNILERELPFQKLQPQGVTAGKPARLENPRTFERAIKLFAMRIRSAFHRAHVFISSRPSAWRACSDRDILERKLPFQKLQPQGVTAGKPAGQENTLSIYWLNPLTEKNIRDFAEDRKTPEIDRLIDELQRNNLMLLAERPFDLEYILDKWAREQRLDGRLKMLIDNIDSRLKESNPDRALRQPLNQEKAKHGARLLAAAVILTGKPGIRVPDSNPSGKGINAETVLGDWQPAEVQALLERGIFNDVLYGMVRFRHREVRELLAAEWFDHKLKKHGAHHKIEYLFFREKYGQQIIRPRLRSVLSWLILFDDKIRWRALEIDTEIVIEGGDAAYLPYDERREFLHKIVTRIAIDEDYNLSVRRNIAIARIAQPDLTNHTRTLINEHYDNDDVISFLCQLVWQGKMTECVPVLLEIAVNPDRTIYARIAAVEAIMTCGKRDQKTELWKQLTTSLETLSRWLLSELVKHAEPNMISVKLLLESIDKLEPYESDQVITGLGQELHNFIDRLPINHKTEEELELLTVLIIGLNAYLERKPYIQKKKQRISEQFIWLLGPSIHFVERLVSAHSNVALSPNSLAVMMKGPEARSRHGEYFREYNLHELVPAWKDLNDALFWLIVKEAPDLLTEKPYCNFEAERFDDFLEFIKIHNSLDSKKVALIIAYWLSPQSNSPSDCVTKLQQAVEGNAELVEQLNTIRCQEDKKFKDQEARLSKIREENLKYDEKYKKEQEKEARERKQLIKELKADPSLIRHHSNTKPCKINKYQIKLLDEIKQLLYKQSGNSNFALSCTSGAKWEELIPDFGNHVAQAYRDAAMDHWRLFKPDLQLENYDKSLSFAIAGLEIELCKAEYPLRALTEGEFRHALCYLDLVEPYDICSRWLKQLYNAYDYKDMVINTVWTKLRCELECTKPDQHPYYLHYIVSHNEWIHQSLAPRVSAWLKQNEPVKYEVLYESIYIVLSKEDVAKTISALAKTKLEGNKVVEHPWVWYAYWIDVDADQAVPSAEQWLSNLSAQDALDQAQLLIKLIDTQRPSNINDVRGKFLTVKHLKALYVLMHKHIRIQNNTKHAGKGRYSPELPNDMKYKRERFLNRLSEIEGKETYDALTELAENHPNADYRPRMRKLAYERAEKDTNWDLWSAEQVREYDQNQSITPTTNRQLFDLTVDCLTELKYRIEKGNYSPYTTWQKAESEAEIRNLVADWLDSHSQGRYTCSQENELANRQRTDIWMQSPNVDSPVPIELKLLDNNNNWTGPKLCERLCNQLAGDYLREETADSGVFLLVCREHSPKRRWKIDGKEVALPDLCQELTKYWNTISNKFPGVEEIKVLLIDLTARDGKSQVAI